MDCTCLCHNGFLTERGYAELAQRSPEGLEVDGMAVRQYLDKVGSVSALAEAEDYHVFDGLLIDEQYRRFLHGW